MKKIMFVFGTRPDAIKMCPIIKECQKQGNMKSVVCVTGQHKEMLQQVLDIFKIIPDYNLSIMQHNQDLFDVTVNILKYIKPILISEKPDIVLVHGDTTTAYSTAMACFYLRITVGHIEAGLRTGNVYSPFPEEFNRQAISLIARYHFAPTEIARDNLVKEGKQPKSIYVTGNTVIDALKTTIYKNFYSEDLEWLRNGRGILLTAHRRENLGEPLRQIFRAIRRIALRFRDVRVLYPIHMNPEIRQIAHEILDGMDQIKIIEPLDVISFHNLMNGAYLILTDSGGIQEEAPSLGKPVLVIRNTTERPEGVEAGTLKLVGTGEVDIYNAVVELLTNTKVYEEMSNAVNPYGDGCASERIVSILGKL